MPQPIIEYSKMTAPQMLIRYNELAKFRDIPRIEKWKGSFCELAQQLAILRTRPVMVAEPPPKTCGKGRTKQRATPIRSAILRELAAVSHYIRIIDGEQVSKFAAWRYPRKTMLSVGYPYPEILQRIRLEFPDSRVSGNDLRWTATMVRDNKQGFTKCTLPQKRPHGGKKGID